MGAQSYVHVREMPMHKAMHAEEAEMFSAMDQGACVSMERAIGGFWERRGGDPHRKTPGYQRMKRANVARWAHRNKEEQN